VKISAEIFQQWKGRKPFPLQCKKGKERQKKQEKRRKEKGKKSP